MKQAFRLSSASRAGFPVALSLIFIFSALISARAQVTSPTPDPFIAQITASATNSFAYGISGNGRFVVVESTGNLAPSDPLNPTAGRNNADGNREIFIYDYAQRRIFQITSTRHAVKNPALPAINPTSATDFSNIDVEISNNRPVISYDGKWIVFSSNAYVDGNAANPKDFDGTNFRDQLKADGNQELFIYRIPDVADVNLSSGAEVPFTNLAGGTLTRITSTPASILPIAGTTSTAPFVADDNRFPSVNDDASIIAFISSRNIANVNSRSNADANPEVFVFNRNSGSFSQLTNTANPAGSAISRVYNANPSLSGDGATVAFISSAALPVSNAEATADQGNDEVYVANFNGTDMTNLRQVTRTPNDTATGVLVNLFSFGRRISRNGNFLLFESRSNLAANGTNNGNLTAYLAVYLYNVGSSTVTQVGPRPTSGAGDVARYPTFTGDSANIVFASALNFNPDGSPAASDTSGLNPPVNGQRRIQIFSAPVASPNTFARLTNVPTSSGGVGSDTTPYPSETLQRIAFTYSRTEFGGGNSDNSTEAYYLLLPPATSETPASANAVAFFTGASNRPVVTPLPSPNPNEAVTGLAPAMLANARSTTAALAPSAREIDKNTPQDGRVPPLPIELNGVSVSINNAAAGLYFVSPTEINFVVPPGLAATTSTPYNVVINNNGAVIRSTLQINASQPDLFTSTSGAGGRAVAQNVTNRCFAGTPEPADGFPVTSPRLTDNNCSATTTETVPTELLFMVTGIPPNATAAQITVTLRGARDVTLSGAAIVSVSPSRTAGFQQIIVRLPADAAGLGDATVVVSVNTGGATNTSRSPDTAPRIRIR